MWSYALWVKNDLYRNEESEKKLGNEEIEIQTISMKYTGD
jgi:hypothetical protein